MYRLAIRMGLSAAFLASALAIVGLPSFAEAQRRRGGSTFARAAHRARAPGRSRRSSRAETPRIAVALFVGPRSDLVREQVLRALERRSDVELVPERALERAADRIGGPPETRSEFEEFADIAGADAVVFGNVRHRRGWRAVVRVRAADGEVIAEETFTTRQVGRLSGEIRGGLWDAVGDAILATTDTDADADAGTDAGTGTDADTDSDRDTDTDTDSEEMLARSDEPEAPPPMDLDTAEDDADRRRGALDPELFPDEPVGGDDEFGEETSPSEHSPLQAAAGLRVFRRSFSFVDDASGTLQPYTLPLGPEIALAADWYPAAHVRNDVLSHLGVTVSFEHALGLSSQGPGGESYPTSAYAWGFGARFRLPIGASEVSATAGYGRRGFSVDQAEGAEPAPAMANVAYDALEAGIAARVTVTDRIRLYAEGAYLAVLGAGDIATESYFPGATATGLEAALGGGYALNDSFELRLVIDWRRYTLTFDPASNRNQVAGATDEYWGANASIAWSMDPPGRGADDLLAGADDLDSL